MTRILLLLLKFYQYFISPMLGNNCRFHPTCSEYSKEAIILHGSLKGLWLAFKRIIKCQPFCSGGYDAVPIIKGVNSSLCHSHGSGNPITKKCKHTKFLKLKAQIISLFSGSHLHRNDI